MAAPIHSAQIVQFDHDVGPYLSHVITDDGRVPLAPFLAEGDIVVNCTLQDPNAPLPTSREATSTRSDPEVSSSTSPATRGWDSSWARPTTLRRSHVRRRRPRHYYAVDHSPSYLWDSATWEIGEALTAFLATVMAGPGCVGGATRPSAGHRGPRRAIVNPAILTFQNREPLPPYRDVLRR